MLDILLTWLAQDGLWQIASLWVLDALLSHPWWTALWAAVYMLPSAIAVARRHPNQTSIFIVNLFLGWTFLGWVVALAWSLSYFKHLLERPSS